MSKASLTALVLCVVVTACSWAERSDPVQGPLLERAALRAGASVLYVEVARTPQQIRRGLMDRVSMDEDHGMLFVFPVPDKQCFWMKDTSIALTAAFLDENGSILNLADMEPYSREAHCSQGEALYVVEAHRGWFQTRGINRGDRLTALHPQ